MSAWKVKRLDKNSESWRKQTQLSIMNSLQGKIIWCQVKEKDSLKKLGPEVNKEGDDCYSINQSDC